MMTLEMAKKMGLIPFVDERHFCIDCKYYKHNAYMGKCNKNIVQYPKILNRCNMYAEKVLQTIETTEDKPFWEI
jgi:hypothetical protein